MSTKKTLLENKNRSSGLGTVMWSNIRLLVWGWCTMWGILGLLFSVLWLCRYFA